MTGPISAAAVYDIARLPNNPGGATTPRPARSISGFLEAEESMSTGPASVRTALAVAPLRWSVASSGFTFRATVGQLRTAAHPETRAALHRLR